MCAIIVLGVLHFGCCSRFRPQARCPRFWQKTKQKSVFRRDHLKPEHRREDANNKYIKHNREIDAKYECRGGVLFKFNLVRSTGRNQSSRPRLNRVFYLKPERVLHRL